VRRCDYLKFCVVVSAPCADIKKFARNDISVNVYNKKTGDAYD